MHSPTPLWRSAIGAWPFPITTALALSAVLTSACADSGQLGQTTLAAPCPAGAATCVDDGVSSPIAAGATFALEVKPQLLGGTAVPLALRAVDPAVAVINDDGKLQATGPGITAILISTDDGGVVDLTHIAVQKINRLSFHRGGGTDLDERELPAAIEVFPNEVVTLSLRVWHDSQQLIGEVDESWAVDNSDFRLVNQGFAQERRLQAPSSGSTTLTVSVLGEDTSLTLRVSP